MAFCAATPTPLAQYAKLLRTRPDVAAANVGEGSPRYFPMYTVPLRTLLEMKRVEPHELLKAREVLVEFDQSMGNAAFVSHQWISQLHPDPEFTQMQVLQNALQHALDNMQESPGI